MILLCRRSLLDAGEHSADVEGAVLGVQVRRDSETHLTYVAIRVIGSWSDRLTAVVLNLVPGCDPAAWFPEYAMPERPPAPAEQIWSNVMDPEVAVKLMGDSGHGPL